MAVAEENDIRLSLLETLNDIDDIQDWIRVRDRLQPGGVRESALDPEIDSQTPP